MYDPQRMHIGQCPQQLLHDTRDHLLRLELQLLQNLDNRSPLTVFHHDVVFFLVVVQLIKRYYRRVVQLREKGHLGEELVLLGVFHETGLEDLHCPNLSRFLADCPKYLPVAALPDNLLKIIVILGLLLLNGDKRLRIDRNDFKLLPSIFPLQTSNSLFTILIVFRLYFPNYKSRLTRSKTSPVGINRQTCSVNFFLNDLHTRMRIYKILSITSIFKIRKRFYSECGVLSYVGVKRITLILRFRKYCSIKTNYRFFRIRTRKSALLCSHSSKQNNSDKQSKKENVGGKNYIPFKEDSQEKDVNHRTE